MAILPGPNVNIAKEWTPESIHPPDFNAWWVGKDGLTEEGNWRDRIAGIEAAPAGDGNVEKRGAAINQDAPSWLQTGSETLFDPTRPGYWWSIARLNSTAQTLGLFFTFAGWFLYAQDDGPGEYLCRLYPATFSGRTDPFGPDALGRLMLVGMYWDGSGPARLDVNGVAGPNTPIVVTPPSNGVLEIGTGTAGFWKADMDHFEIGFAQGEDLRERLLEYVVNSYSEFM